MRQALWLINSSFLFLFLIVQVVFFILHMPLPRRTSLEPDTISVEPKKLGLNLFIKNIYEQNDLFGTYVPVISTAAKTEESTIPLMPEAPAMIPLQIALEKPKPFIAPLPVILRGVMYNYDASDKSIAIIQFQDSKEEINYRVGQFIADAQILKIYANRVILIRSNGQQETLYLSENEASKDMKVEVMKDISSLVIPVHNGIYHVPIEKLTKNIKSLGRLIEILDLTTVYKKGKSVGCSVKRSGKDTLADKLGLKQDDIVEQVDGMPVTDMSNRLMAFDKMMQKKIGDQFIVKIERLGKPVELKYMFVADLYQGIGLQAQEQQAKQAGKQESLVVQENFNIEQQKLKMLEQRVKLAPTIQQIEMEERKKIFDARRKQMFSGNMHQDGLSQSKVQVNKTYLNNTTAMTSGAKRTV